MSFRKSTVANVQTITAADNFGSAVWDTQVQEHVPDLSKYVNSFLVGQSHPDPGQSLTSDVAHFDAVNVLAASSVEPFPTKDFRNRQALLAGIAQGNALVGGNELAFLVNDPSSAVASKVHLATRGAGQKITA